MTTATQNLENDHVYILKLIDTMEIATMQEKPVIENLKTMVSLIRNFADGLHHAKEENLLFPKMEERGFSSQVGPVAVMLHEHVIGRNYVKGMAEGIVEFEKGNGQGLKSIYQNMNGYIELLRNHINKENNILFRMADNALSENDQQELLAKFEEVEAATQTNFTEQILKLEEFYK
ncbi:MAG: hemerythrin domain-containing protein [Bacteroidales bacterium]